MEFLRDLEKDIVACYSYLILKHLGIRPDLLEGTCAADLLVVIETERAKAMTVARKEFEIGRASCRERVSSPV